ncbi:MAG: DUF3160 domain-containing protein [Anaerolineae bacterium]|nr:DUF3160 domain-containing protein [Anaerolineae bacterium]
MRKLSLLVFVGALLILAMPTLAQEGACESGPAPRLEVGEQGLVATEDDFYLNVRNSFGLDSDTLFKLAKGEIFDVVDGPICADSINWWQISQFNVFGWIAESSNNQYLVDPFAAPPLPPLSPSITPLELDRSNDLPVVTLAANPDPDLQTPFITWDWEAFMKDGYREIPDPLTITLPETYQGDMPIGPFDLSQVRFVDEVELSDAQMALLAQNGFVVVPTDMDQFEDAYRWSDDWNPETGHSYWVTTDSVLHALHVIFDNLLQFLEKDELYYRLDDVVSRGYSAAAQQLEEADGLEDAARGAAVYYAVALGLLDDAAYDEMVADEIKAEADPLIATINTAQGVGPISFLPEYQEDFSQYIVRGHYAGDDVLERYFRTMSWLGRITFLTKDDHALQTSLLALRALQTSGAYDVWGEVSDTLTFLIGPTDNLGPVEYLPIARDLFGTDLSLAQIADTALLDQFRNAVKQLPGPRINNVVRPIGTEVDELDDATRGFRLFGQRFTLDSYAMQRLIYPYVGVNGNERTLPSGLDVASALGSDIAYALLREQGAPAYENYDTNLSDLRDEMSDVGTEDWLQNVAGSWLWALQPLWARDPDVYPALMNSQPWLLRDLQAGLGSWAELKHDTLLYTAQPMGGLGGGGERTMTTHGMIEPNPLVFSRVSLVSYALLQGLKDRGMDGTAHNSDPQSPSALTTVLEGLRPLSELSAMLAEMARKELWGEPLTDDEESYLKYNFGSELWYVRYFAELPLADPPRVAALVSDVASNPDTGEVLQVGNGHVDYIYVITDSPDGLQLTRGSVYSYYEFIRPIDGRLTDEEWRDQVEAETVPPRPDWVSQFAAN